MGSVPIIKTHTLIRHTYNDPCDHVSGICPSGCQDGYMGTYCNNGKIFISFVILGLHVN